MHSRNKSLAQCGQTLATPFSSSWPISNWTVNSANETPYVLETLQITSNHHRKMDLHADRNSHCHAIARFKWSKNSRARKTCLCTIGNKFSCMIFDRFKWPQGSRAGQPLEKMTPVTYCICCHRGLFSNTEISRWHGGVSKNKQR